MEAVVAVGHCPFSNNDGSGQKAFQQGTVRLRKPNQLRSKSVLSASTSVLPEFVLSRPLTARTLKTVSPKLFGVRVTFQDGSRDLSRFDFGNVPMSISAGNFHHYYGYIYIYGNPPQKKNPRPKRIGQYLQYFCVIFHPLSGPSILTLLGHSNVDSPKCFNAL